MFPLSVTGSVRLKLGYAPDEQTVRMAVERIAEKLKEAGAASVSASVDTVFFDGARPDSRLQTRPLGNGRMQASAEADFLRVRYTVSMRTVSIAIAICLAAYWAVCQFSADDPLRTAPSMLPWLCLVWLWLAGGFWVAINVQYFVWLKSALRLLPELKRS